MEYVFIAGTNRSLIWLNMLFYLSISIIPFSAAMLGRYPENQLVEIMYGVNMIAACQFIYWIWRYGMSAPDLCTRKVPADLKKEINILFMFAPALYAFAIGISFVEPIWSFYFYLITPLFYLIPTRLDRYLPGRSSKSGAAQNAEG